MNPELYFIQGTLSLTQRKNFNDAINKLVQAERKLERLRCQEVILKWGLTYESHETANVRNTALKLSRALDHTPDANI